MVGVASDGGRSIGASLSIGDLQVDDQRHESNVHVALYKTPVGGSSAAAKKPFIQVRCFYLQREHRLPNAR